VNTIFPRAIDVARMIVSCTTCGERPTIVCSSFGLYNVVVIESSECEHGVFQLEDMLINLDDRALRETLALLGYWVPRGMN